MKSVTFVDVTLSVSEKEERQLEMSGGFVVPVVAAAVGENMWPLVMHIKTPFPLYQLLRQSAEVFRTLSLKHSFKNQSMRIKTAIPSTSVYSYK